MIKVTTGSYRWVCGLVQERCNSIANALELRLSCTNPSIYNYITVADFKLTKLYALLGYELTLYVLFFQREHKHIFTFKKKKKKKTAHHGAVQPLLRSGAPCILNCQITATTRILRCITQISLLNLAFTFALSYTGEVTMFMVTPFTVSISICGDVELLSIGGIAPLPPTFAHTTRFAEYRMYAPLPSWHKLFILWSILLTHSCTDKFSLCHHPELPLYTI